MIKLKSLLESDEGYRGTHTAPNKTNGSPLYNITGTYPDDIYSHNAVRYYGSGRADIEDYQAINIIKSAKDKPNFKVKIYRALPKILSTQINDGDWVTITKQYAIKHGESALDGKYKIISKVVSAKELFTDGNSIQEWGYSL